MSEPIQLMELINAAFKTEESRKHIAAMEYIYWKAENEHGTYYLDVTDEPDDPEEGFSAVIDAATYAVVLEMEKKCSARSPIL